MVNHISKAIFAKGVLLTAVSLGFLACEGQKSTSELTDHATSNPNLASIVKIEQENPIREGETETVFGLVSGKVGDQRLYFLSCKTDTGVENYAAIQEMAAAIGFGGHIRDLSPIRSLDPEGSEKLNLWRAGEQPVLSCKSNEQGASLRKVLYPDNSTKFFAKLSNNSNILFNLGCDRLPRALGLDPASAKVVPYDLLTSDYDYSDTYDIHCFEGSPVGQGIVWTSGKNSTLDVKAGDTLPDLIFTAQDPMGKAAALTTSIEASQGTNCDWIKKLSVGSSYLFQGTVPSGFSAASCKIVVTATASQTMKDSRSVLIRNRRAPELKTNCPATQNIKSLDGFTSCEVKATAGKVAITAQSCEHFFMYNEATSMLVLTKLPPLGETCSVTLKSQAEGLSSAPFVHRVATVCGENSKLVDGKCVAIVCEGNYSPGDTWTTTVANGTLSHSCNADGTTSKSLVCNSGYTPLVMPSLNLYSCSPTRPTFPICPEGTHRVGSRCVPDLVIECPVGSILLGDRCVDVDFGCAPGYRKVGDRCVPDLQNPECAEGSYWDGQRCVSINLNPNSCPAGTLKVGNKCIPINDNPEIGPGFYCPSGTLKVGSQCIPINHNPEIGPDLPFN